MARKLFCEICPLTYQISVQKNVIARKVRDFFSGKKFAKKKSAKNLPVVIWEHKSLIRRVLGNTDMTLQENKAVNLSLAAPKVNGILIRPGETFSFWKTVGKSTAAKGYKKGLVIAASKPGAAVGGGMCQFSNLLHWMVLHSPLDITEHHHHDGFDLFPDFNRKVPFGTGTSVSYNYVDYRVTNNTDTTFQFITYVDETHLCGELRADKDIDEEYLIESEGEHFVRENGEVYRKGKVYRSCIDKKTGKVVSKTCIRENHARVMYDTKDLTITEC